MNLTHTVFVIFCSALVFFMTPGLALFYGGFDREKNTINLLFQNMTCIALSSIMWVTVGYSLCFSGDVYGVIGNLDNAFLFGVDTTTLHESGQFPLYVFIFYQMMFAVITPALMTGAFTQRMRVLPYLLFIALWQLIIYYPFVHMVWGGGLLAQMGVFDFAGGIVVHITAGFGALAVVSYLGQRSQKEIVVHNTPLVVLGTAMLWFGWFGFNGGSALAVNEVASVALLNSQISASFAAFSWFLLHWFISGKPQLIPFCVGSIAGLATITPCAGFVSPQASMFIGAFAGIFCYICVAIINKRIWDDALDVCGVHGMGGALGSVLLAVFSSRSINPDVPDGLILGNLSFFVLQFATVIFSILFVYATSYLLIAMIDKLIVVRPTAVEESNGVDKHLHGEVAYNH